MLDTKLYIPFPGLIYFITGSLYQLIFFTRPLATISLFFVSVSLSSFYFVLKFHISEIQWHCLSLTYFTQHSTLKVYTCCQN